MCKSNNKKKCITKQKTLHRQTTKTPLSSDFREQINTKLAFTYTHTQKKEKENAVTESPQRHHKPLSMSFHMQKSLAYPICDFHGGYLLRIQVFFLSRKQNPPTNAVTICTSPKNQI